MIETILEKIIKHVYLPRLKKVEHDVGCKLRFHNIPDRYINGWVTCEMTKTWKKFGLDIKMGANYFTMGHAVNGASSRFDPNAPEYQSWLGGYTVRLSPGVQWTPEYHFKLAVADQNSWLKKWYGDPNPVTTTEGWHFVHTDKVQLGQYSGNLYKFGCTTDDDVGKGYKSLKLRLASIWMAALFNLSNHNLRLKGNELKPKTSDNLYERLKLSGYVAIFDVAENVKVVLYGNGIINEKKNVDTLAVLKDDILKAMQSCEIIMAS